MSELGSFLALLPADWRHGRFVGRVQTAAGPTPILVEAELAYDMSALAPTVSQLIEHLPVTGAQGTLLGPLDQLFAPWLSPVDLQVIKACGVTFATSTLERVIEEQARGDATKAAEIRSRIEHRVGGSIGSVIPGSAEAQALKELLIAEGLTNGIHARAIAGRRPHGHSRRSWARPRTPCRRGIVQIGLVAVAIPAPVRRPLLALHAQEPFALSINRPKPLYRVTQPGKEPLAAACMISLPMLSG